SAPGQIRWRRPSRKEWIRRQGCHPRMVAAVKARAAIREVFRLDDILAVLGGANAAVGAQIEAGLCALVLVARRRKRFYFAAHRIDGHGGLFEMKFAQGGLIPEGHV